MTHPEILFYTCLESVSGNSDDKAVYNPLNLPLGFDGRPIPYWLYKLHGLGTEFKCEIWYQFEFITDYYLVEIILIGDAVHLRSTSVNGVMLLV